MMLSEFIVGDQPIMLDFSSMNMDLELNLPKSNKIKNDSRGNIKVESWRVSVKQR